MRKELDQRLTASCRSFAAFFFKKKAENVSNIDTHKMIVIKHVNTSRDPVDHKRICEASSIPSQALPATLQYIIQFITS